MSIWKIVRDALALDVQDFSYLYTPRNLQRTLTNRPNIRKRGLLNRIAIFFGHAFQSIVMLRKYTPLPPNQVLFVFNSTNQRRSLAPIYDEMPEATMVYCNKNDLPLMVAYLFALPFFPLVACKFLRAGGEQRTAFYYLFDEYWTAYGYYLMVRLLLRRTTPKTVVVANDHLMWLRAFVKAAQDEKIPTVYVQHASVTERFPPLSFDYALLEGVDTLQKYASCGPSAAHIFLVGMPKFDAFINSLNENDQVHSVGICTNPLDKFEEVKTLCDHLKESFPDLSVFLRPHPGDKRNRSWEELAYSYDWHFSNGNKEGVFQFLQRVDAIIAGDSSIHLEATLLNVFPIYYVFGRQKKDSYGFQHNGLVEYFGTPDEIRAQIANLCLHKPSVRGRTRVYNATIGTAYDGRSTELACSLINQIALGLEPDLSGWKKMTVINGFQAYQPDEESLLIGGG